MTRLSDEGFAFLLSLEKDDLNIPKKDSHGDYYVGLGYKGSDIDPQKIYSMTEIKELFETKRKEIEKDVNKVFDERFMSQRMFDALFAFAYNVGRVSTTELGRIIKKNPFNDELREFWSVTWTNGGKNKRLIERRKKEVEYYLKW